MDGDSNGSMRTHMDKTIESEMNDRVALQLGRLILMSHQKDAVIISKDIEIAQLRAALSARSSPVPKGDDAASTPASGDQEQGSHSHAGA